MAFENLIKRVRRFRRGFYTPLEFAGLMIDVACLKMGKPNRYFFGRTRAKRFRKKYFNEAENVFYFKDAKLPCLTPNDEAVFFTCVFDDTYMSYLDFDDKYDEATFDYCQKILPEGLYGLVNDRVKVTVEPGDIVIDAGSWIGDFAAYASVKVKDNRGGGGVQFLLSNRQKKISVILKGQLS